MKKLKYVIFILFTFFFIFNINVKAVSKNDLSKINFTLTSNKDKICVYSIDGNGNDPFDGSGNPLRSEFTYLIIVFTYDGNHNAYQAVDFSFSYQNDNLFYYSPSISVLPYSSIGSDYYDGNCSNYYPFVQQVPTGGADLYNINLADIGTRKDASKYYSYDANATTTVTNKIKGSGSDKNNNELNCSFMIDKNQVQLSSFVAGTTSFPTENHFITSNQNYWACPATTEVTENTTGFYTRIKIDINSFKCSDWQIVRNPYYSLSSSDNKCYYYLVKNGEETHQPGTEVVEEGNLVATYADYNNSSTQIRIVKEADGSYSAIFDKTGSTKITISNIGNYTSILNSGEKKDYPLWINEIIGANGSTYQFSDKRIDGANNRNFIEVSRILEVVGLGNSEVYKTCQQLFTTDFLKFLNNTFFKILYIGIPIILIVLTTFDFAKVVFSDDKEGIQKAGKTFGKRVVMAVLIYLVPTILIFIGNLMGTAEIEDCAKALQRIGEENKTS